MILCSDNIFFDISDADFRIDQTDYDYQGVTTSSSACNGGSTADFSFSLESLQAYTGTINYSGVNLPAGATIAFTPASTTLAASGSQTVDFTLSNLGSLAPGTYDFQVETDDGINVKSEDFSLEIFPTLEAPVLLTPVNGGFVTPGSASFDWSDVANADATGGYGIQFYLDAAGNNPSVGNSSINNSRANFGASLDGIFTEGECYYWRAFARNTSCDPDQESMSPIQKFTFGDALPVTWLDFTARPAGKTAFLNWSVEQDALNAGFAIERNTPGINNWEQVGYSLRSGLDGVATYTFTDDQVEAGHTYHYRLRQEDLDDATAYSEIRTVAFEDAFGLTVVPNPTNNFVLLNAGTGSVENLRYTLYDPAGRKVSEGSMNGGQVRLEMANLPAAIYQVLVTGDAGYREVARVVKR